MITLRKYLYGEVTSGTAEAEAIHAFCKALTQLSSGLLDGLEQHVFNEPHSAFQTFATEARKFRDRLEGEAEPNDVQSVADNASTLLREFRQARDQVQQSEASEVHKMVSMLNETIAVLASGSERSLSRLRQVETELKNASALSDIVALKSRLNACMTSIREERTREQQETARNISEMKTGVQRAQEGFTLARTGIATRREAEKSIAEAVTSTDSAVAIIVIDLIPTIKSRYNQITAERFVSSFAQELAEHLPSPNRFFRWNEQSLMVTLPESKVFAKLMSDVRERLAQMPRERQMIVGQRSTMFSNAHRWTVMRPAEAQTPQAAVSRIDQFVQQ